MSDVSQALRIEHITIVTPPAEMDDMHEAADAVIDTLKKQPPTAIILDLSRVTMFPSTFLAFLLRCHTVAKKLGADMLLAGASEAGLEVLSITNLDKLWTHYHSRDEALAALTKREDGAE